MHKVLVSGKDLDYGIKLGLREGVTAELELIPGQNGHPHHCKIVLKLSRKSSCLDLHFNGILALVRKSDIHCRDPKKSLRALTIAEIMKLLKVHIRYRTSEAPSDSTAEVHFWISLDKRLFECNQRFLLEALADFFTLQIEPPQLPMAVKEEEFTKSR
jgi:hypothetical protein